MKLQQYHESIAAAQRQIRAWRGDQFSSFGKDYMDYTVTKVTLAKRRPDGSKNVRVNGRRLYTIHMKKKKRRS